MLNVLLLKEMTYLNKVSDFYMQLEEQVEMNQLLLILLIMETLTVINGLLLLEKEFVLMQED